MSSLPTASESAVSILEPALGNVRGHLRDLSRERDEDLLARYRTTGSRDCFAELVRRYESELYSYLRRYLGSAQHAEDTFQAVFLQVHLKCDQFQQGRPFRPWLYAIATNQAIDAKRRHRRRAAVSFEQLLPLHEQNGMPEGGPRAMSSREPDPATEAGDAERKELLDFALGQLSEPMRTAIQLVFYQGLKYREAAEILCVPVGTVKSRVHAAVQRLTELWQSRRDDVD